MAQSQPDRIAALRANTFAHRECVVIQRVKCLRPILSAMDVRAIRQMQAVLEFHQFGISRCCASRLRMPPFVPAEKREFSALSITRACSVNSVSAKSTHVPPGRPDESQAYPDGSSRIKARG